MFEHDTRALVLDVLRNVGREIIADVIQEIRREDMATIAELQSKVSELEESVREAVELANKPAETTGITEADLDPIAASIDRLRDQIESVVAQHTAPEPTRDTPPVGQRAEDTVGSL